MTDKQLDHINFPEGSTNVIFHMTDGSRVVFASLEIRMIVADAIENNNEIDFDYSETEKYVRIGEDVYSATTRELEKGSWLFFGLAKKDKE